ncbi:methyltransferase domain-containing protein [Yoonia sp. SS1-5]|uniref:Methyltransferase domain-containing protein n=1 Tax=Yoonia rhodophyticola TaxID=3137370 RepID=A0AAN0M7L9_9RHOB
MTGLSPKTPMLHGQRMSAMQVLLKEWEHFLMADPFQDVDAAGEEFIAAFADSMDARQADPVMEGIVSNYLAKLRFPSGSLTVEVGAGAGAVTRRVAAKANPERVVGFEPSAGFVREAKERTQLQKNVSFEVADGAAIPVDDSSVQNLILHTVLTHVEKPLRLLQEARRVLKPDGRLVVCDADFSKACLGSSPCDPLDVCAKAFVREFVTDPHIVAKLRDLIAQAGFVVTDFDLVSRSILNNDQMLPWVEESAKRMLARGEIGQALFDGLVSEYKRRATAGRLYGYQIFATAIATPN